MNERPGSDPTTPFFAVYAAWMQARADLAGLNALPQEDDAMIQYIDAVADAEWRMIRTPSDGLMDIKARAEVVGAMFTAARIDGGEPTDGRLQAALAVLLADIQEHTPTR